MEGLVASAGTLANIARKQHIVDVLDRYREVEASLRRHDERYPTAADLRRRTVEGAGGSYGKPADQILGEGKDSEASRFIIELLERPDPDPLWFCFWGGSQELGQALWRLRKDQTPDQVADVVRKIRIYFIGPQDGSAKWIMDTFPQMFVIFSAKAFEGMHYNAPGSDPATGDLAWLNRYVRQDHGALGALYPRSGWNHQHEGVIEGDTPSSLYLISGTRGLSDLNDPGMGGWGGRFQRSGTSPSHWVDSPEGPTAISRWHEPRQRDFAARMDRCVHPPGRVNRPPHAMLNGERGYNVLRLDVKLGQRIRLDASRSSDPDRDALSWNWWVYREGGTYSGAPSITGADTRNATVAVPPDAAGKSIHIVLEVTDSGSPRLTTYRRMVLNVRAGT